MEIAISNFIHSHLGIFETTGYYIVFICGLLESTPFFGFFIPGQTIMIIAGFVAKTGAMNLWTTFLVGALGAIVGDILSFFLGRKYGERLMRKYGSRFFIKQEYFDKTKALLEIHTGKTLFFGRFQPLTRSLAPFAAGVSNISISKFLLWASLGGFLWASIFVFAGFIFGASYDIIGPAIGKFILSAIIITALIIGSIIYLGKRHFHFAKRDKVLFVLSIISLYIFATIAESVSDGQIATLLDKCVYEKLDHLHTPTLTVWALFATNLGSAKIIATFTLILSAVLTFKKNIKLAFLSIFAVLSGAVAVYLLKIFFGRQRPLGNFLLESGGSFPSAHAALSVIFFFILSYCLWIILRGKKKKIAITLFCFLVALLIGLSRIYLEVHWTSDVLGGFVFGIFWSSAVIMIFSFVPWLWKKVKSRQIVPNL